jgi:HD-GYP domain-containing protein (c-di-GMP phosphodiesterase class II)
MRKVAIENVKPGMITRKPILGFLGQVLLNADVEIKPNHIYYLKQMGINAIYVHDSQMNDVEVEDVISFEVRGASRALVAQVMKDLDAAGSSNKGVAIKDKEVLATVMKIVEELIDHKDVLVQLSDIRAQDGYLFAHSVNCCVLATLIATKMNYDLNTLKILATGALLHDIGLIAIPQMILKKPGALTAEEYEAVKQHPQYGYEIFKKSKLFSERAGDVVLQHHERSQGQGYPQSLKGKEIASLARIMLVADVYDALTSDKLYRKAYPVHEAIEMLISWGGEMFDLDVLKVFLEIVTAYPVGSHVQLSSGESGLVVANNPGFALHPVVRLLYKRDFSPHPAPFDLDLRQALDMTVDRLIDESELPAS